MSEKKKFMPTITNYLSDDDDDIEDSVDSNSNPPQVQTNYAEWKRLQKASTNLPNGTRSVQAPLGDISSCEEDSKFEDNEPLFKIMNCLADKESFRRRNESLRRKHKKPSHFLLFSRMKQQKHFDCSFSDLVQITQASWENMQTIENEELMGNIDLRIREYKEVLTKFRTMLLPDATGHFKCNSWVSAAVASKHELHSPSDQPPIDNIIITKIPPKIPERLQNLAGNASVYSAPDKSKRTINHSYKSYKTRNIYNSDTSLNYVNAINSNQNCNFPDCENKPIDDYRWDGQYCSAKCLIKDCHLSFHGWLVDQKQLLTNGNNEPITVDHNNEDEIMLYLASPASHDDSDGSIGRDETLFESLRSSRNNVAADINTDTAHSMAAASSRLHSLINRSVASPPPPPTNSSDHFEDFRDRATTSS